MITSIFSKSKPINFVIVAIAISIVFIIVNYPIVAPEFQANVILKTFFKYTLVLFFVFVFDFIISKNFLSKKNSYALMTFGLLFFMFPKSLLFSDVIVANLFILFSLRRLISLHSKISIKKKLFDAAFWIGVASLFYFWSILFFIAVLAALIYFYQNDFKNIIIPFVALITVAILYVVFNIITTDTFLGNENYLQPMSFDFSVYNDLGKVISLTIFYTLFVWILFYYIRTISDKPKKLRPSYNLIIVYAIIALVLAVISDNKSGAEEFFIFVPFALLMANFLEVVSEKWFKEALISLIILAPIVDLVL
ncbi:MAG: hypothetical protein KJO96_01430 [Winogradskyella sp.]|nr:hypothetical protein [Winogradskyella sp.]